MKNKILLASVLAALALSGCNKPAEPPAATPGPAGPAGAPGATGATGNTGATGSSSGSGYTQAAYTADDTDVSGDSIGVDVQSYPQLEQVPGYPVYYAPGMNSNYFFYDGMYWVYQRDRWYAGSWYNGPWSMVAPDAVPLFVLRIPVRYYREPPAYFRGWQADAPPQWGVHWGNAWEAHHGGWDKWNHGSVPAPAPLPAYQKQYSGSKYPAPQLQVTLHTQNYHYQPKDAVVQHVYQAQAAHKAAAPSPQGRPPVPEEKASKQMEPERSKAETAPEHKAPAAPHAEPAPKERENAQKPAQAHPQKEAAPPYEQPAAKPAAEKAPPKSAPPEPKQAKPAEHESRPPEKAAAPHEQPAAKSAQEKAAPPKAAPPEPKQAKPAEHESRPPEKAAAPHEQPAAKPAQEKAAPPKAAPKEKEEKHEEERK